MLVLEAAAAVQLDTATPVVVIGVGQVVVTQLLADVAADAEHVAMGVGPEVAGAGQVVVVYPLTEVGPDGAQDATGNVEGQITNRVR